MRESSTLDSQARTRWLAPAFAAVLLLFPRASRAEGFLDLYVGAAVSSHSRTAVAIDDPAVSFDRKLDYRTDPSTGLRGGYWFEGGAKWLGLGLDFSYYRARDEADHPLIRMHMTSLTPLLMLRLPLATSEDYPNGRVQPYVAAGPSAVISVLNFRTSQLTGDGDDDFWDAAADIGADARAGLAVQVARHLAVFTEYRFTQVQPDFEDSFHLSGVKEKARIESTLRRHHVGVGVSFRF